MTVAALSPSIIYVENGVTTNFAVPFRFKSPTDLRASRISPDGTVTAMAYGADFTATGGTTDAGGMLTLAAPASVGVKLAITRSTPRTQAMVYTTADTFPAKSHEGVADQLTLIAQEQDVKIAEVESRALKAPLGETFGSISALAWATRAGALTGFDDDGNPALFAFSAPAFEQIIGYLGAIVTVAGIADEVADVAAVAGAVTTVAGIAANITTVAGIAANVTTVAGISGAVSTVAGIAANVTAVAGIAANITIVAGAVSNINIVAADLALGGGSLIATAGSVVSAIQALLALTPLYTNENGESDRRATMRVIASAGLLAQGVANNLVNGNTSTSDATNSIVFVAQAAAGHYLIFDHYEDAQKLITEANWLQAGTNSHGVWQWQLSQVGYIDDETLLPVGAVWENVGGTFTLGGSTSQTQNSLSTNTKGARLYRLLGISGNTTAGWNFEIRFKVAGTILDRKTTIPNGGLEGDRLVRQGGRDRGVAWQPRYGKIPVHAGVNRLALWMMDDERDSGVIKDRLNPLSTSNHFDFRTDRQTWNAAPKKTAFGWRFDKCMVRMAATGLTNARTYAVLMRGAYGASGLYEISTSVSGEPFYLRGSTFRNGTTVKVLAPNGEIMPVFFSVSGTTNNNASILNRGYWRLVFITTADAMLIHRLGLGGDPDHTSEANSVNYANMVEFAYLTAFDADLSDAQMKEEANWICPVMKRERGITLRNLECDKGRIDFFLPWGQSNQEGQELVANLPPQLKEYTSIPQVMIKQTGNQSNASRMRNPAPYQAGVTSQTAPFYAPFHPGYPQQNGRRYGPDLAVARDHSLANRPVPLHIEKVAAGSTILGGPVEGTGGTVSWNVNVAWGTNMTGYALTRLYESWDFYLAQGIAITMVAFWWGQGETDVGNGSNPIQVTNWGTNLQDVINACVTYTGGMWPAKTFVTRLRAWETNCVLDQTGVGNMRTVQTAFIAADATNRVMVDADGSETDAWGRTVGFRFETNGIDKLHHNGALMEREGSFVQPLVPWSAY